MNIVKQSTGNVVLTDASGNIQKVFVNVNALEVKSSDEIIVKYGFNQWHSLFASQIDNTQIEPAGAVPFTGNVFDLVSLLSSSFFFDVDLDAQNLASVLGYGNQSGSNDIIFDLGQGIVFDNGSQLKEGTTNGGLGGNKGIAQFCSISYELKWEAGRLYVMEQNGFTIRWVLFQFNNTPSLTDDSSLGYVIGSRWTLDNGDVYVCTDNTLGAAVWTLENLTSGFVPYTGATNDLNLGTYNLTADHIALNISPSGAGYVVGATEWNNTIGSSQTLLKGGSVSLKNGVDLVARVVNKVTPNTTLTKAAYQVVKVSGAQGQRLAIDLAQANNDNNSADTLGVVIETIATNQEGFILTVGQIEGINTTGSLQGETWADGDVLYLSPTVAGRVTNVKPTGATGHIVIIGYVEYSHAINGKIYVKIMNGWELDELHNVYINTGTLANNDALIYESSTQLWKNKTIATALGFTPVTNARTISTTSPLSGGGDLTANRTISIQDAAADGTTKGAATFSANDFNSTSGLISIDYTNGQSASGSNKGFLTSSDWTAFNGKVSTSRTLTINGTAQDLSADRSWNTYAIVPVQSVVSAATVTPTSTNQLVIIMAQAAALTLANPTGAFVEGQPLMIRIKDNGTARAINYDTNYRAIGVTLPTTTVINKTTYLGIIYNAVDGKWDVIGVTTQA